ncbi:MAG: hypothetical protein IGR92_16535 [Leptolyngbyaceae cyanobacterium T60_A2020_046]|nr:hypothetical protein [Leptolyngbyaceae cyanobacterium T60_A2020_046]
MVIASPGEHPLEPIESMRARSCLAPTVSGMIVTTRPQPEDSAVAPMIDPINFWVPIALLGCIAIAAIYFARL